jgi:hypothetical protein
MFPGGTYYSAYEAGFCGYGIHRELNDLGIKNIVINAEDIPTSQKDQIHKLICKFQFNYIPPFQLNNISLDKGKKIIVVCC